MDKFIVIPPVDELEIMGPFASVEEAEQMTLRMAGFVDDSGDIAEIYSEYDVEELLDTYVTYAIPNEWTHVAVVYENGSIGEVREAGKEEFSWAIRDEDWRKRANDVECHVFPVKTLQLEKEVNEREETI